MFPTAVLIITLLHAAPSRAMGPPAAQLNRVMQTRVERYELSTDNFLEALTKVAADFDIPIGIEWVRESEAFRPVKLSVRATTVQGILGSIVKAQSGYTFAADNGIVHVFRRDLLTDSHNFLNLRIANFEVKNELGGMASRKLQAIVKRMVGPPRSAPRGAGEGGSYAGPVNEERVTLSIREATVRDILDKLVLTSDFKVWVVTFTGADGMTDTGFRRTATLMTSQPVRDDEQPVWELLTWDDARTLRVSTIKRGK